VNGRPPLAEWRNALRDSALDTVAKCAGFVLSTYFTADGRTGHDPGHPAPSKATIARGISRSKRNADAVIECLEEAGFLRVERSRGRRTNEYEARLPIPQPNDAPGCTVGGSNGADRSVQPCNSRPLTVQPAAPECGESVESGARTAAQENGLRAWLKDVGAHFAHDADAFAEEAEALGVGAVEAERLRLELLDEERAA
jgi:hypothetical protein